ncbi:hypothetical protein BU14_0427s0009 [Porphyra umbilicalis]|uniref:Uncharacterized protein n=1 Tax=Porphyra umbilicalis TaxID=2786 RepID=A0A1X6NV67_PORUM|nr:hypothetical protein BU14_0427s0009 [Porphyra umbilicalis]|eukprot:OSX72519.1 hypothetical protein BU14_0427s0009 [Porphyra umbilicalis]
MGRATNTAMPAIALAPAVPAFGHAFAATAAVVMGAAAAGPLRVEMPKLPKMPAMPKLPSLPGQGKKADAKKAAPTFIDDNPNARKRVAAPRSGDTKVRAGLGGDASKGVNAPTLAEIQQSRTPGVVIKDAAGGSWKAFPQRRMPGANMSKFRELAGEMKLPE